MKPAISFIFSSYTARIFMCVHTCACWILREKKLYVSIDRGYVGGWLTWRYSWQNSWSGGIWIDSWGASLLKAILCLPAKWGRKTPPLLGYIPKGDIPYWAGFADQTEQGMQKRPSTGLGPSWYWVNTTSRISALNELQRSKGQTYVSSAMSLTVPRKLWPK